MEVPNPLNRFPFCFLELAQWHNRSSFLNQQQQQQQQQQQGAGMAPVSYYATSHLQLE